MKIYQKINKRKSTGVVKKYKLLGITCFSKGKTSDCVKYSLFGIKFKKKRKRCIDLACITTESSNRCVEKKIPDLINFSKFEEVDVSIIIPVYDNYEYTMLCLQSILENTQGISYEVIIGDDNSNDETKNIKQHVKNVTVVRNQENLRFLKNCNHAAQKARGKYILFLNNDTQVQKDWLKYLYETIEADNTIGLVGSKLVYPDGTLQEAGGIIYRDGMGCNYGRNQNLHLHKPKHIL